MAINRNLYQMHYVMLFGPHSWAACHRTLHTTKSKTSLAACNVRPTRLELASGLRRLKNKHAKPIILYSPWTQKESTKQVYRLSLTTEVIFAQPSTSITDVHTSAREETHGGDTWTWTRRGLWPHGLASRSNTFIACLHFIGIADWTRTSIQRIRNPFHNPFWHSDICLS